MSSIKMVLFDLDGTLLNTLDDLANAGNYAVASLGYPEHAVEKYKYFVGNGIPKLVERILPKEVDHEIYEKAYELFCSYYDKHMNDMTRPYPGVIDMLKKLKDNNIISVVVTNKADEFASQIVHRYFGDLITATYGSVKTLPPKPDPALVNIIIEKYNIDKKNIIYIGDSGVDMCTAKNAGLFSCGVTWGFRDENELLSNGADMICHRCDDVLDIIFSS